MEVFGGHHHEISMISCGMEVFGGHNHDDFYDQMD
jgi:hypothetical protein